MERQSQKLECSDYLSGVWAHYAENMNILEEGDHEEAYGTSAQRVN